MTKNRNSNQLLRLRLYRGSLLARSRAMPQRDAAVQMLNDARRLRRRVLRQCSTRKPAKEVRNAHPRR